MERERWKGGVLERLGGVCEGGGVRRRREADGVRTMEGRDVGDWWRKERDGSCGDGVRAMEMYWKVHGVGRGRRETEAAVNTAVLENERRWRRRKRDGN